MLERMLFAQRDLTEFLFENADTDIEPGSSDHLKETVASLAVEASEALAHFLTSTKPWKPPVPDLKEVDEEMIDVLHFLLTYWNLRGLDAREIAHSYFEKNRKNRGRLAAKLETMDGRVFE